MVKKTSIKVKQKQNVNVHVNIHNNAKKGKSKKGNIPSQKRGGTNTIIPFSPVLIHSGFPNQFQPAPPVSQPVQLPVEVKQTIPLKASNSQQPNKPEFVNPPSVSTSFNTTKIPTPPPTPSTPEPPIFSNIHNQNPFRSPNIPQEAAARARAMKRNIGEFFGTNNYDPPISSIVPRRKYNKTSSVWDEREELKKMRKEDWKK
jgi:hypothetical protein